MALPETQLTISFRAMQRMRTTMEDFIQSYFPYAGLDPAKDLFRFLDVLMWVEGTIYQLDEDNEALARTGQCQAGRKLIDGSALPVVLEDLGLMDAPLRAELQQGDLYWEGERRLCAAMLTHTARPQRPSPTDQENDEAEPVPGHPDLHGAHPPFQLQDVLAVHEAKSFDYRVLHLLLRKLAKVPDNPLLMDFLRVDEMLVDIGDDLTDYEDDVEANSFNILRAYVHLYGPAAPLKLVERISLLEQQHEQLLHQLPADLQQHYWARHQQAVAQGGSEASGRWVFPPLIYNERAFRDSLQDDTDQAQAAGSVPRTGL